MPLPPEGELVVEILYDTVATENVRHGGKTRISSCHCHRRAGWWWKSYMTPLPESMLGREVIPALVLATAIRGRVGRGNPI